MDIGANHLEPSGLQRTGSTAVRPPDSIDRPALSLDQAATLMGNLGFLAFRTPAEVPGADSCLLVVIRDAPTLQHFDPTTVEYWTMRAGRGQREVVDRESRSPLLRRFAWGRIRLDDRLGVRNEFVSMGGWLIGERIGSDALLLIFRSPAPILRVGGHSQPSDLLADDVVAFFSRLTPRLWNPSLERTIGLAPPEHLWCAFLVHEQARLTKSSAMRDEFGEDVQSVGRELRRVDQRHPEAVDAGRRLLELVAL
jgi:hypothetical protein